MRLLFFGQLADIAGNTVFDLSGVKNTDQLKEKIFSVHPELSQKTFVVAVNKKIQTGNTNLGTDDTIALMPPFSGG